MMVWLLDAVPPSLCSIQVEQMKNKMKSLGHLAGKYPCHQYFQPEFHPGSPHAGNREPTSADCSVTCVCCSMCIPTPIHKQAHKRSK